MRVPIVLVRQGPLFPSEYVRLFERFDPITLTDQADTPGRTVPLRTTLKGWWSKMELFAPWFDHRPCLFFDLDTYVLDDIDDLRDPVEQLWLLADFNRLKRGNSGVMRIPDQTWDIWSAFRRRWKAGTLPHGDGDFLDSQPHMKLQEHVDGIVSYKLHARQHPRGRVVCFHGQPKPHNADGWAGDHWKRLTLPRKS